MKPVLFKIPVPEFLQGFLPEHLSVYSYGFCIAVGIILAFWWTAWQSKKQYGIVTDKISNLLIYIVLASFIGGKIFFYLENPAYYFGHPKHMIDAIRSGFTFYGSLLFSIPVMIWFFRTNKLPVLGMLDIMAVTACIVHACGRVGCFMAGCCHGVPTDSFLGVTFTNPACSADPLNVPLHPTQLYDVFMLVIIMIVVLLWQKRKQFDGQLFLIYLILYAIGRSIIEIYRGDEERGFVIKNIISNSQFIAFWVIVGAVIAWWRLLKKHRESVDESSETDE